MDDHDHPELDWDPLDDTKVWSEEVYEPKKVPVNSPRNAKVATKPA